MRGSSKLDFKLNHPNPTWQTYLKLIFLFHLITHHLPNQLPSNYSPIHLPPLLQLALRAGNEKDEDTADTVGCCSLRVEHLKLHEALDGKENVVEFDFLGKDSIRCVEAFQRRWKRRFTAFNFYWSFDDYAQK